MINTALAGNRTYHLWIQQHVERESADEKIWNGTVTVHGTVIYKHDYLLGDDPVGPSEQLQRAFLARLAEVLRDERAEVPDDYWLGE